MAETMCFSLLGFQQVEQYLSLLCLKSQMFAEESMSELNEEGKVWMRWVGLNSVITRGGEEHWMGPSLTSSPLTGEVRACLCFPMCCEFPESREHVFIVMVTCCLAWVSDIVHMPQIYAQSACLVGC